VTLARTGKSISYFKHAVFALRFWFRIFGMEDAAIKLPSIKKNQTLPVVLSKQECKQLFKAPPLALLNQARQQALNIA
jgi:site-specific recombinase XerD